MRKTVKVIGKGEAYWKRHLPALKALEIEESDSANIYVIATPNYLHVPLALYALAKGKEVLLEKPIATSLKDALLLTEHPLANKIGVCYQRRFDTQAQVIKKLKDIQRIDCVMHVRRDDYYWNSWRKDKEKSGGGALINIFIHYFDLLQWWLGKKYEITFAKIAEKDGVDQSMYVEMDFNGIPVTFEGSSIHADRKTEVKVQTKNKTISYNKEDASHEDIYREFIKGNKISVKDAFTSLQIVYDIYHYTNSTS